MSARIVCGDVLTQVSKCTQMFADFISRAADARQASSALSHLHTTATVITNITNLPKPPLSLTKVTYTCTHPRLFVCLSALLNYVKETFKTSPSQWRRTKFTQYHTKMPKTPSVSLAGACRNLKYIWKNLEYIYVATTICQQSPFRRPKPIVSTV